MVNATWMAARPQWNLASIGLTKSVQPYCRLAIIVMQMMPNNNCHQRPASMPCGAAAVCRSIRLLLRLVMCKPAPNPRARAEEYANLTAAGQAAEALQRVNRQLGRFGCASLTGWEPLRSFLRAIALPRATTIRAPTAGATHSSQRAFACTQSCTAGSVTQIGRAHV